MMLILPLLVFHLSLLPIPIYTPRGHTIIGMPPPVSVFLRRPRWAAVSIYALSDVYHRHHVLVVILKVLACHTPYEGIVVCA